MRLMTRAAVHRDRNFVYIPHVHLVLHRVFFYRVTQAVLDGEGGDEGEVVVRQLHLAFEDCDDWLVLHLLRLRFRTMALETERVHARGPQQLGIVATVWLMTG